MFFISVESPLAILAISIFRARCSSREGVPLRSIHHMISCWNLSICHLYATIFLVPKKGVNVTNCFYWAVDSHLSTI